MNNFRVSETKCVSLFNDYKPFWHLCTSGHISNIIFREQEDYVFAVNLLASCTHLVGSIRILTFSIMSNHIHIVACGEKRKIQDMFDLYKKRLKRYLTDRKRTRDLDNFICKIIPIQDLPYLRNNIAYVNRNGYLVNSSCTPFSYPWSAGQFFFNMPEKAAVTVFGDLTLREKRSLLHTRYPELPSDYAVDGNIIRQSSFCDIKLACLFFRDAHNYFNTLTKNLESQAKIASDVDEDWGLTDNELFYVTQKICKESFVVDSVSVLPPKDRISLAKELHFKYKASNKQIARVTGLSEDAVNGLFPLLTK